MLLRYRALAIFAVVALFASPAFAQLYYQAAIDGLQQVPPNGSPGVGFGCFTLNADYTLDYEVSYFGMLGAETAAHIHGPAPAGVNAAAIFPFPLGTPKVGTFGPLTLAQVLDLNAGLYYVNIHSTVFAGGEIRGQILPAATPCTVGTEESTWGAIKALYK